MDQENNSGLYNHATDLRNLQVETPDEPKKRAQEHAVADQSVSESKPASTGDSPVDPLKIHNKMQQEAILAKKVK